MKTIFFASAAAMRAWLARYHDRVRELAVGFHRKVSGKRGVSYPEAIEEALCFGWIDGVAHKVDDRRWTVRFTPRTRSSSWSLVNIRRARALIDAGRMTPAGLAAFERRDERRAREAERARTRPLDPELRRALRADPRAWSWFRSQPPWVRRTSQFWVTSAKKPETRARRLATLIDCSARGVPIPPLAAARKPR